MSEETKEEREQREKKEIAYYTATLNAWINTSMEHDKSLLTLSTAGIGLLIGIAKTQVVLSSGSLILYIIAILSFLICLSCILIVFKQNKKHIENIIQGNDSNNSLKHLDNIASVAFFIAIFCSVIIGISVALNSFKQEETVMTNKKITSGSVPIGSVAQVGDSMAKFETLAPTKPVKSSVEGIQNLKPQPPQPKPSATASDKGKNNGK